MGMVSTHCSKCFGSGQIRYRGQIGEIRFMPCKTCNGLGRKMVQEGSGEHRIGKQIINGLGPGIRKGHSKYAASGTTQYGRR